MHPDGILHLRSECKLVTAATNSSQSRARFIEEITDSKVRGHEEEGGVLVIEYMGRCW